MNSISQWSTAKLQSQRAFLMSETRSLNPEEVALIWAIDNELRMRNVLSIGINF